MRLNFFATIAIALMAGACQPDQPAPPAAGQPAPLRPSSQPNSGPATSSDEKAKYEAEISKLQKELADARAKGLTQYFNGYSAGSNDANSEAYPVIFADLGEVYLSSGPQDLTDVRIELNYKAQGGGYFEIKPKMERFHIWRIPRSKFVDENGKEMSPDQKIVSVRLKATRGGKQIVKEGDTLDIGGSETP